MVRELSLIPDSHRNDIKPVFKRRRSSAARNPPRLNPWSNPEYKLGLVVKQITDLDIPDEEVLHNWFMDTPRLSNV